MSTQLPGGNWYQEIAQLKAENERLRKALETIAEMSKASPGDKKDEIARRALTETPPAAQKESPRCEHRNQYRADDGILQCDDCGHYLDVPQKEPAEPEAKEGGVVPRCSVCGDAWPLVNGTCSTRCQLIAQYELAPKSPPRSESEGEVKAALATNLSDAAQEFAAGYYGRDVVEYASDASKGFEAGARWARAIGENYQPKK